jgi:hypothetical protein
MFATQLHSTQRPIQNTIHPRKHHSPSINPSTKSFNRQNNMNFSAVKQTLRDLKQVIEQLSPADFANPMPQLSNASIGEHTRHTIEFFQCLIQSYSHDMALDYDNRARNKQIQTNPMLAVSYIQQIIACIERPNKILAFAYQTPEGPLHLPTNYFREVLYNLEHCVHHQALIRVAMLSLDYVYFDDNFGVAAGTIKYRQQCAP